MAKEKLYKIQSRFAWTLAKLILYAESAGYDVTLGRGFLTPEQNKLDHGMEGSLHCSRLAQDLNFFKTGKYLTATESLQIFGEWWESQGDDFTWGGRFKKRDGNHFSLAYNGKK